MSAKIIVVDGVSANTEHWIEHEVCRVGSGSECQVQIPGMPEHALTLQFRDQKYFLFNRGQDPIYLRKRILQPAEVSQWKADTDVQIGDYAILKLVVQGDPRPAVLPRSFGVLEPRPIDAQVAEAERRKKKQRQQIAVIALCILGSLTLLLTNQAGPSYADHMSQVYSELDNRLLQLSAHDAKLAEVRVRLQHARTLELGGHAKQSQDTYRQLKDWLLQQPATLRADPFVQRLEWYVLERLRILK